MVEILRTKYLWHYVQSFSRLGLGLALILAATGLARGQTMEISLVKDFNPYRVTNPTNINGTLYFFVDYGDRNELWKSDGTEAGTVMIKFFRSDDSLRFIDHQFVRFRNETYFAANDDVHGTELWKTDGTPGGTVMVMDLLTGSMGAHPELQEDCVTPNGFYFSAMDKTDRRMSQLWKTDGTAAGTVMITDAPHGGVVPKAIINNNILIFESREMDSQYWLWSSDGTASGTVKLKSYNHSGLAVNGQYFFISGYYDGLWKSDGTVSGTVMLKNFYLSGGYYVVYIAGGYNGNLYLAAFSADGDGFWRSDGTAAGTVKLKDLSLVQTYGSDYNPRDLCVYRGKMYFSARNSLNVQHLWESDGTAAGTVKFSGSPDSSFADQIVAWSDKIYFFTSGLSPSLWSSDGTAAGTVLARDFPGDALSNLQWFPCGNKLFFTVRSVDDFNDLFVYRAKQTVPVELSEFSVY